MEFIQLVPILISAGCPEYVSVFYAWRAFNIIHPGISDDQDFMKWLADMCSKPTKLKQMCRTKIRRLLSHNIQREAETLSLPPSLKDYILLKDVL